MVLIQDIPVAYWREVGVEHFSGGWFTVAGPSAAVRVKSSTCVAAKQTFYYLTKGWAEFVALNDLKLGDKLVFAANGDREFDVFME